MGKDVTCACGHTRRQHSKAGCTDGEFIKGKWVACKCRQKYMDF